MLYSPRGLVERFFTERDQQAFEQLFDKLLVLMLFEIIGFPCFHAFSHISSAFPFPLVKSRSSFNIQPQSIFFRKLAFFTDVSSLPTSLLIVYNLICILNYLHNCFESMYVLQR